MSRPAEFPARDRGARSPLIDGRREIDRPESADFESNPPLPVILDVDTGIDDAFALMLAVRSPRVDLRAVTCVAGNASVDQVVVNTAYVLDVAGASEVPVGRGAARPLLADPAEHGVWHGVDGLGGFARSSDRRIEHLHAVELLRRELTNAIGNGDTVTLVALAPQTNIALLLRAYPEVAPGIERLVFMGGSASVGNVTPVAEFNVFADPEAAAVTLAAASELNIPVTMYGLDVFLDVVVTADDARRLSDSLDSAAQLAGSLLAYRLGEADPSAGGGQVTIGDAGALCAVIDPAGLQTEQFPVVVETSFGATRGQTVVDRRPPTARTRTRTPSRGLAGAARRSGSADGNFLGALVDVALGVDATRYRELWLSAFSG